jgi:hypothetical protein
MAMPTGLRVLAQKAPSLVPWAWGVNGAASVLGSVAALLIALSSGFDRALLVGAGLYLAAIPFARTMSRPAPADRGQRGDGTSSGVNATA